MSKRTRQLAAAAIGAALLIAALVVAVTGGDDAPRGGRAATTAATTSAAPVVATEPTVAVEDCRDPFAGVRSPYRMTDADAETSAAILNSAPEEIRHAYRVRAIARGDTVVAIVTAVRLTDVNGREGFFDGAQRAARRAGDRLEPAVLSGQRALVGDMDGEALIYGLTDCGALIVQAVDLTTARTLHGMIAA